MKLSDAFPLSSFHALATKIKKQSAAAPFALQIGAMDGVKFDLLNPHLTQGGWNGLLVEPVGDMFEILQQTYKNQPDIKLVNCAIGKQDGTMTLRRIRPETVAKGLIPEEALGITTEINSKGLLNNPKLFQAFPQLTQDDVIEFSVPCLTLPNLLHQNGITTLDLVMIDTEGADWMIAQQLDLSRYQPKLICLEHSSLTDGDKRDCLNHFVHAGYNAALCQEDKENFLFFT